jgi:hypothetical protein
MSAPPAFGRRAPAATPPPASAVVPLSDAAEAFRGELAAGRGEHQDFGAWRRRQSGKRWLAWALGFALLTPGLLGFVLQAPPAVSSGLEIAGIVVGAWLRSARRRHLAAIRAWGDEG